MKSTKDLFIVTGFIFLFFTFANLTLIAQTLKDINGKEYKICKNGPLVWSAENLNVDRFQNGDIIPQVKTDSAWIKAGKAGKPAWCYYNNDTANGRKFGKLYNYYAITDPRGLAPKGWHISGNSDYTQLIAYLGGVDVAGIKLKSPSDWQETIKGNNKSGFTAIPGGSRSETGAFKNINKIGQWWSTSGVDRSKVEKWSVMLNSVSIEVSYAKMTCEAGLSVRLVKD